MGNAVLNFSAHVCHSLDSSELRYREDDEFFQSKQAHSARISPDERWALGDDFDRSLWLVKVDGGEKRLLSTGHTSGEFRTHPHGSFTPDSRALVFSSSKFGAKEILLLPLPSWKDLT